ncbi:vanadium-dependent haloperoxidase [Microvirga sp. STR05]|uniref:Vanadium-dependent haloperoxidase n=1 Tax=Hymenobacter duratus TaxID=2771356 RepID=A0ABR8JEG9_9BACT|nr:vanadium-dependent haloperoxidase [Hymenobacter duratus]MBD2715252.1 vanadium-dependent haloperoxidase [Hymenobacter duratus]MBR7950159.1 vanadium-dependent haloperoxidase [Microvirga sp. STR05]
MDKLLLLSTTRRLAWSGLVVLALLLQNCQSDKETAAPESVPATSYTAEVADKWAKLTLQLVRTSPGFTPPVTARALGYAGLTMYESVVAGIPGRRSMAGQLQDLSSLPQPEAGQVYNWQLSANAAQASILKALFANTTAASMARIDSLETALARQHAGTDEAVADRSGQYGRSVAQAIFTWSRTDGGHEGYNRNFPASFTPASALGDWQPTENGRTIPMQPYWGSNRTFLATDRNMPMPVPISYSSAPTSQYYAQYLEVYAKNRSLTQEEKEIAIWWADDPSETFTPPGHSYNLARILVNTTHADLGKATETFARTGIAVADAFILCWKCKYIYNNERPYTFVRRFIDPTWVPFWPAPPFPGFPSGHATQSAATAIVLEQLYGNITFTDDSHVGRGRDIPRATDFRARTYHSFWETAEESALSRFLGGIHSRQDNEIGLREGRKIGQNVNALSWR